MSEDHERPSTPPDFHMLNAVAAIEVIRDLLRESVDDGMDKKRAATIGKALDCVERSIVARR